ncbi:MAG: MotA/TolQ/ExbB proton channel family protein, partial [Thermodesulfobacteriota bacterium]
VIYLVFRYSVDGNALWKRVSKCVREGEVEKARSFCRGSEAPLAMMLDRGLSTYGKSERELQNAVDEVSLEVIPSIDRRVPYLAMVANVATLLGLLGTIQGLIQAFSAVGAADPSQKAALLASGISLALYTTAFGLIVAIPMLITYSLLQSKAHRLVDEIDEFSVKLINLLVHNRPDRRTDG